MKRLLLGLIKTSTLAPLLLMCVMCVLIPMKLIAGNLLAVVTSAIGLAMGVLILVAYFPPLVRIVRRAGPVEEQNLVLGQIILWTSIVCWSGWRILFIALKHPEWMIGHWFVSLLSICAALSGFYFLGAPGTSKMGLSYTTIGILLAMVLGVLGYVLIEGY